jgi:hypothetical protein
MCFSLFIHCFEVFFFILTLFCKLCFSDVLFLQWLISRGRNSWLCHTTYWWPISRIGLARLKMFGRWHLNPDVQSQHRYESKYFHEKDLNNSNFIFFLLNTILCFRSQVKTISKLHLFHWQLRQFRKIVTTCVNKHRTFCKRVKKRQLSSYGLVKHDYRINLT